MKKQHMPSADQTFQIGKALERLAPIIKQQMAENNPPTFQSVAEQISESLGFPTTFNMVKNLKDHCGLACWHGAMGKGKRTDSFQQQVAEFLVLVGDLLEIEVPEVIVNHAKKRETKNEQ